MISNLKTYYPNYVKRDSELWDLHIKNNEVNSGKPLTTIQRFFENFVSYPLEYYGHEHFDYLVTGTDILVSLISSIEKALMGKKVLIYPSGTNDAPILINKLINERYSAIGDSIVLYVSQKYDISIGADHSLSVLVEKLCEKVNSFRDADGFPLIYIYSGSQLYSYLGEDINYKGHQVIWPRDKHEDDVSIDHWREVEKNINKFSLVERDAIKKSRKEVNSTISTERMIVTSRTSFSFCHQFINQPVLLGEAFYPIDKMDSFKLKHRLADILSAMSINNIEAERNMVSKIKNMYEG